MLNLEAIPTGDWRLINNFRILSSAYGTLTKFYYLHVRLGSCLLIYERKTLHLGISHIYLIIPLPEL
jgi:hypothetical protein